MKPYFSRIATLEDALSIVSRDDPDTWLHAPLHADRAETAIAIACLLNRRDIFDRLVEDKTSYLAQRQDRNLLRFTHMAESLAERWHTSQGPQHG
jgi:hypothetical protein